MNSAVLLLLFMGIILVYAATRDWFASNGLDPEYYLKRQLINVIIGIALAYGTTLVDYRLLRAYTPVVWGVGVLGLIAVLIPGLGSTVNGARSWISFPGGFQIQPAELAKISIIIRCTYRSPSSAITRRCCIPRSTYCFTARSWNSPHHRSVCHHNDCSLRRTNAMGSWSVACWNCRCLFGCG